MISVAGLSGGVYDHLLVNLHAVAERRIPEIVSLVYRAHHAGQIDEGRAAHLHQVAQCRQDVFGARRRCREHQHARAPVVHRPKDQRLVEARNKRRTWGSSGALPQNFRCHFTLGENAVAAVIREEVRKKGNCAIGCRAIAKSAGLIGITVVKRFIKLAEALGLIKVERRPIKGAKNLPNVITIIHSDWLKWNALADRIGGTGVSPLQNRDAVLLSLVAKPPNQVRADRGQSGLGMREPKRVSARAAPS